jgi:hypothetical protein
MQLEAVKKDGLGRFMGRPVVYKWDTILLL